MGHRPYINFNNRSIAIVTEVFIPRYTEILVEIAIFVPHLYLMPPFTVTQLELCQGVWSNKLHTRHRQIRSSMLYLAVLRELIGSTDIQVIEQSNKRTTHF